MYAIQLSISNSTQCTKASSIYTSQIDVREPSQCLVYVIELSTREVAEFTRVRSTFVSQLNFVSSLCAT